MNRDSFQLFAVCLTIVFCTVAFTGGQPFIALHNTDVDWETLLGIPAAAFAAWLTIRQTRISGENAVNAQRKLNEVNLEHQSLMHKNSLKASLNEVKYVHAKQWHNRIEGERAYFSFLAFLLADCSRQLKKGKVSLATLKFILTEELQIVRNLDTGVFQHFGLILQHQLVLGAASQLEEIFSEKMKDPTKLSKEVRNRILKLAIYCRRVSQALIIEERTLGRIISKYEESQID